MSYVDKDILKGFLGDDNFISKDPAPAGLDEAILQADSIIYQYTHLATPATPNAADPILRNIACALVIWYTSGMGTKLDEQEYERRKKQYDDAMTQLREIQEGKISILDSTGTEREQLGRPAIVFSSTRRLTELP